MAKGDNCSSACLTRDHDTFGECVRGKGLKVAYCGIGGGDASTQAKWDRALDNYRAARAEGIQPAGTAPYHVQNAVRISNETGKAYVAP